MANSIHGLILLLTHIAAKLKIKKRKLKSILFQQLLNTSKRIITNLLHLIMITPKKDIVTDDTNNRSL